MLKIYQFFTTLCGSEGRNPFWINLCTLFVFSVQPIVGAAEQGTTEFVPDQQGYQKLVAPFFKSYCSECHSGDKPEGEFSLDAAQLKNQLTDPVAKARWREVVNVLNSHEMPPEESPQPQAKDVAAVVDWVTAEAVRAEKFSREQTNVLRRLTRDEYRRTIRDLVAIDFDVSAFPEDPAAGGFDNNGSALTISPMHMELYLASARQILDRALVEGEQPPTIRWKFDPKAGPADRVRLRLDPKNNPLVNGGNNRQDGEWVAVHHASWDTNVGARDFRVPMAGTYRIRAQLAGTKPTRQEVIASAAKILAKRRDEQIAKQPQRTKQHQEQYQRDLQHFETSRIYDYGPVRAKLNVQLGSQPRTIAEFDIEGTREQPEIKTFLTRMTTETAGISFEYAYSIPRELENFWLQSALEFARPELLVDWFEIEGPIFESWPPPSHQLIIGKELPSADKEVSAVTSILRNMMQRAYRRPPDEAEVEQRLAQFIAARKSRTFIEALKLPLISILTSPNFLYLVEGPVQNPAQPLDDYQLATRLSFWLWSSMPDQELLQLAAEKRLSQPEVLKSQVARMLKDARSRAFVENFAGQWLGLRQVGANPPAKDLYPEYDRHLETSMIEESLAYFQEFLQHDLDVRQMIQSDFVVINERLARFYEIDGVRGDQFRRVQVSSDIPRGGIVTQASILCLTSNGTRTSPVKRGTWILKTLLGTDPGLPVANAGEIAPKVPGIDKATVRQRLEIHRELPQCARCHNKIDPLGFALENFNAAGDWREREGFGYQGRIQANDPLIDASSRMPDGTNIVGVRGLQQALYQRHDLFVKALAERLLTYALGRELGLSDQPAIDRIVQAARDKNYRLSAMLESIATSETFCLK